MRGPLAELMRQFPRPGQLIWIGLRPARHAEMIVVEACDVTAAGLLGDRARGGKRALSLIQAEHLPVIAALSGCDEVAPELLRRNLVIGGINLLALRGRHVALGACVLEITGPCAPCTRMETALGPGGYNAMRGHGGVTARVVMPGKIARGCRLETLPDEG